MCVATLPAAQLPVNQQANGRIGHPRICEFLLTPPAIKDFQQLGAATRLAVTKHLFRGVASHELKVIQRLKEFGIQRIRVGTIRVALRVNGQRGLIEFLDQRDDVYGTDYRPRDWKEGIPLVEVLQQIAPELIPGAETSVTGSSSGGKASEPPIGAPQPLLGESAGDDDLIDSLRKFVGASVDQNTRALVEVVKEDLDTLRSALTHHRAAIDSDIGGLFEQQTGLGDQFEKLSGRLQELEARQEFDRESAIAVTQKQTDDTRQLQNDLTTLADATAPLRTRLELLEQNLAATKATQSELREQAAHLAQQVTETRRLLREQVELQHASEGHWVEVLDTLRHGIEAIQDRYEGGQTKLLQLVETLQAENRRRQEALEELRAAQFQSNLAIAALRIDLEVKSRSKFQILVHRLTQCFRGGR